MVYVSLLGGSIHSSRYGVTGAWGSFPLWGNPVSLTVCFLCPPGPRARALGAFELISSVCVSLRMGRSKNARGGRCIAYVGCSATGRLGERCIQLFGIIRLQYHRGRGVCRLCLSGLCIHGVCVRALGCQRYGFVCISTYRVRVCQEHG